MMDNVVLGVMSAREAVELFKQHADKVFAENRAELDEFRQKHKMVW